MKVVLRFAKYSSDLRHGRPTKMLSLTMAFQCHRSHISRSPIITRLQFKASKMVMMILMERWLKERWLKERRRIPRIINRLLFHRTIKTPRIAIQCFVCNTTKDTVPQTWSAGCCDVSSTIYIMKSCHRCGVSQLHLFTISTSASRK